MGLRIEHVGISCTIEIILEIFALSFCTLSLHLYKILDSVRPYGIRGVHSGWSFEMVETCLMRVVVDMGSGGVRWDHMGWGTI